MKKALVYFTIDVVTCTCAALIVAACIVAGAVGVGTCWWIIYTTAQQLEKLSFTSNWQAWLYAVGGLIAVLWTGLWLRAWRSGLLGEPETPQQRAEDALAKVAKAMQEAAEEAAAKQETADKATACGSGCNRDT